MILSEQNNEKNVEDSVQETEENELDLQVDFTTSHDYIASAFQAMNAVDDIDTALLSKSDEMRIKRIRRKSLLIIECCINELYSELFESEDEY
jgi:hypothetical protein